MKGLLEYKSIFGEVKDLDTKKRVVTGYLAAFGNKDAWDDIIQKGAFKKTIAENMKNIFFLNQHNWAQPHGKFNILKEDTKGLYFESKPLIDTTYSSDLMKLYKAKIVKEHSIGYSSVVSEYNEDTKIRTLKEIKLYEGSNVTRGANPKTPFLGMKTRTLEEINEESKLIIKAIREGTFTDDTFMLLEIALKQLQKDAYELGISLKDTKPSDDTSKIIEPTYIETINNFRKQLQHGE